jgi:NADH:ubiquinone oxidoreductase subunit 3 (subunit A)
LLLVCWRAKNAARFEEGNEAVRRALIAFYIKFYLVALISLMTVDMLISNKYTLFVICG